MLSEKIYKSLPCLADIHYTTLFHLVLHIRWIHNAIGHNNWVIRSSVDAIVEPPSLHFFFAESEAKSQIVAKNETFLKNYAMNHGWRTPSLHFFTESETKAQILLLKMRIS